MDNMWRASSVRLECILEEEEEEDELLTWLAKEQFLKDVCVGGGGYFLS